MSTDEKHTFITQAYFYKLSLSYSGLSGFIILGQLLACAIQSLSVELPQ